MFIKRLTYPIRFLSLISRWPNPKREVLISWLEKQDPESSFKDVPLRALRSMWHNHIRRISNAHSGDSIIQYYNLL